ncbi:hypothetical protein GCM10027614_50460 [Micromonospora vulcania]
MNAVDLAPHRSAGLLAPAVDRVFVAGMLAGRDGGGAELSQRYGGPAATGFLVDLRTRLAAPGGTVDGPGFAAITRYRDPATCQRMLDKQVAYGMIHRRPDGALSATDRGAAFLAELHRVHAEVTEELWAGQDERVLRLVEALGRLLAYALVLTDEQGRSPVRRSPRWHRRTSRTAPRRACCCSIDSARCVTTGPTRTPPRGVPPGTPRRASRPCHPARSVSPSSWRPIAGRPARTPSSAPRSG